MKINFRTPFYNYNNYQLNQPNFSGLNNIKTKALFVFDLDGTLATASQKQMNFIFKIAKEHNGDIVYATGRTFKEFLKLQEKMKNNSVILPNPDYLITNNGNFLHENIDGILVENMQYQKDLKNNSKFNRDIVTDTIKKISKKTEYQYSLKELSTLSNFEQVKLSDPEFYSSKISYYEWNPSQNMAEYFLSHDVNPKKFKEELNKELAKNGIKVKFRENHYSKPIMDACKDSILLQANSLRRHKDGSMNALFICAGDKSTGIEFIKKQNKIAYSDILMAGNDDNDIPMAKIAQKGAKFICLNDASGNLINYCKNLKDNVLLSVKNGADAILNGIEVFCKKNDI